MTRVRLLVGLVGTGAAVVLGLTAGEIAPAAQHHPGTLVAVIALTVALQALSLTGFASSISVAGVGMLAAGFMLGTGPAVLAAIAAASVHALKKRPKPYKAVFNAGTFVLAATAGTAVHTALAEHGGHGFRELVAAQLAACCFLVVNVGLLTLAMAAYEHRQPVALWWERLAWLTPHYLAFGPIAFAATVVAQELGADGLAAAALLPLLLAFLVRGSLTLARARHGVVRAA